MIRNNILINLLILNWCQFGLSGHRKCSSCVLVRDCPQVQRIMDSMDWKFNKVRKATMDNMRKSFCGIQAVDNTTLPKICCSDVAVPSTDESESNIAEHKNINLLPGDCGRAEAHRITAYGDISELYEFPWMALISYVVGRYRDRAVDPIPLTRNVNHVTANGSISVASLLRNGVTQRSTLGETILQFGCGGSILNSKYILTAAHCVKGKEIAGVRVGEHRIDTEYDCPEYPYPYGVCEHRVQDVRVEKRIVHEGYRTLPYVQNDIALLRLEKPLDLSLKNAQPICLPISENSRNTTLEGEIAVVAGWGLTETGLPSNVLIKSNVPIRSDAECHEYYGRYSVSGINILNKKLCAGTEGRDACKGDSGGPLLLWDSEGRAIQYGIVSFGPHQCGTTVPGVYTDVRKYVDWILNNIED